MDPSSSPFTPVSSLRRYLPQVLACIAKSLILVDIGLALGYPTVLISALSREEGAETSQEDVHFTKDQASWFASILYISLPVGCIFSGYLTDRIGRKNAMILVNIPHVGAWLLIHWATRVEQIYAAAVVLGLGIGFMETPVVTYIGEICQPSIRGILTSTTGVAVSIGYSLVYTLGGLCDWRTVALVCFTVPVVTILVILFVPETPLWLLMHRSRERAQKSLQWLRGWTSTAAVEAELNELQRYCDSAKKCKACEETTCVCLDRDDWKEKWQLFTATRNLKPFCVVTMFLVFAQLSGFAAMRPYLVIILKNFHIPMDADRAMSFVGLLKLSANLTIMASVKWAGKRRLSLVSSCGVALCTLSLAAYAYTNSGSDQGYFPLIVVLTMAFLTSLGIAPIPWMLLSEVLPIRTRAITSGVTVTINYLILFAVTKTYPMLEVLLGLHGVLGLYFVFGTMGFIFLYTFLPETENRTLEEIEYHFANRPMTDRRIEQLKGNAELATTANRNEKRSPEDLELL